MKKYLKWVLVLLIIIILLILSTFENTINPTKNQVIFNDEELEWMHKHPIIQIGMDMAYAPFEFYEDGEYKGMSVDILKWIESYTGLKFNFVKYETFDEILKAIESKEIDMTGGVIRTDEREVYMAFSDTFYANFDIVLVRDDNDFITEKDLVNLKTGGIKGYSVTEYLKSKYPEMDLIEVSTITEGLRMLSFGEMDAFVTDYSQAMYYIYKYGYHNINAISDAKISIDGNLRFGVRDDYKVLVGILNKSLQSIPPETRQNIQQNWIGLEIKPFISRQTSIVLLSVLGLLVLIVLGTLMINRLLKREILLKTDQLQRELEYSKQMESNLQHLNETLEEQVKRRTAELELLIDDLNKTRENVIRAEKMAFLGNLVAGVAHEINSPLGVVLTGSTHLKNIIESIKLEVHSNQLSRSKLEAYLLQLEEISNMIQDNGIRLSKLVQNFKQLSVEQNFENKEIVDLSKLIAQSVEKFKTFTADLVQLRISCPENLKVETSPKALSQILEHLVQNAIQHCNIPLLGLEITIQVVEELSSIALVIRDNGKGIGAENVKRVFDPFYTTKRHIGSSGLGMHLVYNLVKFQLDGEIEVNNTLDSGFEVTIRGIKKV